MNLLQTPRPVGGFRCVLADPAWPYETWGGDSVIYTTGKKQPYPPMSVEAMKRLPVAQLVAKDCLLIMWIVDANLLQALEIAAAWGFTYSTRGFTWDKGRMSGGHWVRKESEISLIFKRGSPSRQSAGVRDMIREAPREHSRKPDCVYGLVEKMIRGPYLEMFARRNDRPFWTAWGNDVERFNDVQSAQTGPAATPV